MIKYNGVVIDSVELAQDFIDKFTQRKRGWILALVLAIVSLVVFLNSSSNLFIKDNLGVILGINCAIIILIQGLDKLMYLLSLVKRAWIKGWDEGDGLILSFLIAYVFAGFVLSCYFAIYFTVPLIGVLISGARLLKAYRGCQAIICAEC